MSYKWNPLTSKLDRIVGKDEVKDSMIDWGTGTNQVSSSDVPDHNSPEIQRDVKETPDVIFDK